MHFAFPLPYLKAALEKPSHTLRFCRFSSNRAHIPSTVNARTKTTPHRSSLSMRDTRHDCKKEPGRGLIELECLPEASQLEEEILTSDSK